TSGHDVTTLPGASITTNPGGTGVLVSIDGTASFAGGITTSNAPVVLNATDWVLTGSAIDAGTSTIKLSRSQPGTILLGGCNLAAEQNGAGLRSRETGQVTIGGGVNNAIRVDADVVFPAT